MKLDPGEEHDLAASQPAKVHELMSRYTELAETEVSLEAARLCPGPFPDGCRANLATGVWGPWV